MNATLQTRFNQALKILPAGADLLRKGLEDEDTFLRLSIDLLRKYDAPERVIAGYRSVGGFSGGGQAAQQLLEQTSAEFAAIDPQLQPILVRWWPERWPDATCAVGDGGALIRINLGMLTHLRLLVHLLSSCLGKITAETALFGEDRLTTDQAREEYLAMVDEFVGGDPVPLYKTVLVHWGQREKFRRQAMRAGLAYVIAHELGHAGASNTKEATVAAHGLPDEKAAMLVHTAESAADIHAFRLLRKAASLDESETLAFSFAAGAACVLAIQASLFWFTAAQSEKALAWTHPIADLRMGLACLALGEPHEADRLTAPDPNAVTSVRNPDQTRKLAALQSWLDAVTGVSLFRAAAITRGLERRGLSKIQMATIYLAYGIPSQTRED